MGRNIQYKKQKLFEASTSQPLSFCSFKNYGSGTYCLISHGVAPLGPYHSKVLIEVVILADPNS